MTTWLHSIGDALRESLLLVPLGAVRGLLLLGLVALVVWVIRLPREKTVPPQEEAGGISGNLKIWAVLALVLQIVIYTLF